SGGDLEAVHRQGQAAALHGEPERRVLRRRGAGFVTGAAGDRYTSFTFFSGRLRPRLPVAAKIALRTAGVTTEIVGSPTPPQKSPDGTITVSTFGISASRRSW